MSGGLFQLEYNTKFNFLSVKPELTFFKSVYKRHTNFSMSLVEKNVLNFGFGKTSDIKLDWVGDLINSVTLQVTIPEIIVGTNDEIIVGANDEIIDNADNEVVSTKFAWIRKLGLAIIKCVEIYIGGMMIDSQYGEWMYIWLLLSLNRNKEKGFAVILGNIPELITYDTNNKPEYTMQIPLLFWFNKLIYLSLPIIAIRYQDVILRVNFNSFDKLIVTNNPSMFNNKYELINFSILINYIYLDLPERQLFARENHEYLIDQVQTDIDNVYDKKNLIKLDFTLNCRDIIWISRNIDYYNKEKFLCYTHDMWNEEIISFSHDLLQDSIILSEKELFNFNNLYEVVPPETEMTTKNKKININNASLLFFYINTNSLVIKKTKTSITNKIKANILVTQRNRIKIIDLTTKISIQDISIPVKYYIDTRDNNHDVYINQFDNYGKFIDGSCNLTEYASVYCDSYELIKKHSGKFFNVLQPYYYYNSTIPQGINVYPFSLFPQQHQPSGEINFSVLKSKYLKLWTNLNFYDNNNVLNYDTEYETLIFTRNYNTLLINHGMVGLMV